MKFIAVILLMLSTHLAVASTVTIDFQSIEQVNNRVNVVGNTYSEDGYTLAAGGLSNNGTFNGFLSFGTLTNGYRFLDSTGLFKSNRGFISLTKSNRAAFNFLSIDLAAVEPGPRAVAITFNAEDSAGNTFQKTVQSTGVLATYVFGDYFNNIVGLSWLQEIGSKSHQFDNIVVSSADTVSAVPVPASLWLFGSAMLGFCGLRRKKLA